MSGKGHFEGKSVLDHLKAARQKGKVASREEHVTETPALLALFLDGIRDLSYLLMLFVLLPIPSFFLWAIPLSLAWAFFRTGRAALIAWARLARMRQMIEDEKFEIEHNRDEERAELTQMYRMKGLSQPLLGQVIDTLMADDNRLLQVMLEEELGVQLERIDHPLRQALCMFTGILTSFICLSLAFFFGGKIALIGVAGLFVGLSAFWLVKKEKLDAIHFIAWHVALFGFTAASFYFISQIVGTLLS